MVYIFFSLWNNSNCNSFMIPAKAKKLQAEKGW